MDLQAMRLGAPNMHKVDRLENLAQELLGIRGCPKCGGRINVHIAICSDPECCDDNDYVNCETFPCFWEYPTYFGDDEEEVIETVNRIIAKMASYFGITASEKQTEQTAHPKQQHYNR